MILPKAVVTKCADRALNALVVGSSNYAGRYICQQ
jgi:hypothetical protein